MYTSTTQSDHDLDLEEINRRFAAATPDEIIRWAGEEFPGRCVTTSSFGDRAALGLFGVVREIPDIPVITLDPRYFFKVTRQFMGQLIERFGLTTKVYY